MGIQINIGDHISSQAGYITVPLGAKRNMVSWARIKARWIAANIPSANVYFRTLPRGRTLTQLLNDSSIWINYNSTFNYYGETNFAGGSEIAIGNLAFRTGRWTVLATLVHELAHVDGDDGSGTGAERAVLACGLGKQSELNTGIDDPNTPYDPTITG